MAVSVVSDSTNQPEPSPTFVAPTSILSRLRAETQNEHTAVERVLDLMSASLTRDGYRQRLAQFYGFYAPLDTALKNCGKRQPHSALAARLNKTARLQFDLRHLGAMWQSSHFTPVVVVAKVR